MSERDDLAKVRRRVGLLADLPFDELSRHQRDALTLLRERDALAAAVERVRVLHSQDTSLLAPGKWCPACGDETPCRTIRALAPSDPATDTGGEGQ